MLQRPPLPGLLLLLILGITGPSVAEDYQEWSVQTHLEDTHSFLCNDSINVVYINRDDRLTWRQHGHDSNIENSAHFELRALAGVANMELRVKATDKTAGIYFCEIRSASGNYVGRVVKALNLSGHKHDKTMDKYRRHIITGVITGSAVFVLVVGVCAIDHFRYQSEDERRTKRQQKEERLRRRDELKHSGLDNFGMIDPAETEQEKVRNGSPYDSPKYDNGDMLNTQL